MFLVFLVGQCELLVQMCVYMHLCLAAVVVMVMSPP